MASTLESAQKELADIEAKLDGYSQLVEQRDKLRVVIKVLEGEGVPVYEQKHSRAPRASSAFFDEGAVIHACHSFGGPISASELREQLGISDSRSNAFSQKLKAMVDAGLLKKEGERRATKYVAT